MSAENKVALVPEWLVERLARNDLPAEEAARVRARLEAEPGGLERLAHIAASDAEILAAHPPAAVAAEVERRRVNALRRDAARKSLGKRPAFWVSLALPVAAAAALVIVIGRDGGTVVDGPGDVVVAPPEYIGVKGDNGAGLIVIRRDGRHEQTLRDGAAARPGDLVQLKYVAGKAAYGLIVSLDARGQVTPHLPEQLPDGVNAVRLNEKGQTPLPHAFELDASPGFERFSFVTSAHAFAAAPVVEALRAGRALPPELSVVTFTVRKETP